jgi:SAM-dependent methyltransferase
VNNTTPGDAAELDLPPAKLRAMVAGTDGAAWFVESGRRSVDDLARALAAVGRSLESFGDVLEFGCGCGRMSRWLVEQPGLKLTGIDIDAPMIEWCAEHLAPGTFEVNDWLPPTKYANDSFDLVVNHSVFTHLDETYQDRWLEELSRITRADGVLALSFCGETAFRQHEETIAAIDAGIAARERAELEANGILCVSDPVHGELGFPGFYVATFHQPGYVLEHWQQWFELLAYIPRNNLDFQDVVVMRPRR